MTTIPRLSLAEIENRVCDVVAKQLGIRRDKLSLSDRLIEDLHCDSLDMVELIMEVESAFQVALPDWAPNSVYKAVFVRSPFRLRDLAELVYLQQGTGAPGPMVTRRRGAATPTAPTPTASTTPFTQLGGRWQPAGTADSRLLEPMGIGQPPEYRRRIDGMRCVLVPETEVELGSEAATALSDERPRHRARIDAFLIDAEPVSTTAYCRFLNSIHGASAEHLADWFVLDPEDDRAEHQLIAATPAGWQPVAGAEHWPMILVSWFGANAYSLWANGHSWTGYGTASDEDARCFLPTEAQWEYAARGASYCEFPGGDRPADASAMRCAQHQPATTYRVDELPLAGVHEPLGMSPFGLHHMAGNVWQWCRDSYDVNFYSTPAATAPNPWNRRPTGVRSERGGSWVGPADLCRSSHRRGRNPAARGRCLGFRCVMPAASAER